MKTFTSLSILLYLLSSPSHAGQINPLTIIAKEPVSMMDLGIIKLNTSLSRQTQPGLLGATIGATYHARKGIIDVKVSAPVKKASKKQCKNIINSTKKLFIRKRGDKKIANLHHYFQHEGTGYSRHINWNDLANHVVITGIALTKKNYQDSVYCSSKLMKNSVSY